MYRLYEYPLSGNCYKLRLLLTQLGHPFESVRIDILNGENRSAKFLRINPAGKVPVLEIGDGNWLPESNAGL